MIRELQTVFDVDSRSRETLQRPHVTAGDRKRRAACVVKVSADHYTALGCCSRMDGLTSTSLEDVHMEVHPCVSASIHGQVFARNVAHTRVQEPKRFTFPAPSVRRSTYYQFP